jgi:hypothetical protein
MTDEAELEEILAVLDAGPPPPGYVRFDERKDVIAAFELIGLIAPRCAAQPLLWKWLIIAAHNALQGALVCTLSGTAGIGALTGKSAAAVLKRLETDNGPRPKEWLAQFNELLEAGQDPVRLSYLGGEPLKLSELQRDDLRRLNDEFRNRFSHFKPIGWSIEEVGLPRIVLTAVDAAEHLMLNHPAARSHLSDGEVHRIGRTAAEARAALN